MAPHAPYPRSPSPTLIHKLADYTAMHPSEIMQANAQQSTALQPLLVVGISLVAFTLMLMITMIFSFWYWRQQHALALQTMRIPDVVPGDLYQRRAQRKKPSKRVRWQAVVFQGSPTTSDTQVLLNDEPKLAALKPLNGTMSTKRQYIDTPLPYTPYRDSPATATTIDSAPMSAIHFPATPSVPKKSIKIRPAPLNLVVISPTGSKHHQSSFHKFKREPTPYPMATQLTPIDPTPLASPLPGSASTIRPMMALSSKLSPNFACVTPIILSPAAA